MERPINLQRLCAISICSTIWSKPDILQKIRELFPPKERKYSPEKALQTRTFLQIQQQFSRRRMINRVSQALRLNQQVLRPEGGFHWEWLEGSEHDLPAKSFPIDLSCYKEFKKILHLAEQDLNSVIINLPSKLKIYCKQVLNEMGNKLYFWFEFANINIGFNVKLPEKIFWTPTGGVDESKMFEIWERNEEFLNEKSSAYDAPLLHILACLYAQEDYIQRHQDEMEEHLKNRFPSFELRNYENKVYTLMALYLNFHILQKLASSDGEPAQDIIDIEHAQVFPNEELVQAIPDEDLASSGYVIQLTDMFEKCVKACLHKPIYYIWGLLKEFGYEEEHLIDLTQDCLEGLSSWNGYSEDKLGEIVLFLISQISVNRRREFIQKNANLLFCGILPLWPFNEIIFELIDEFFSGITVSEYKHIFTYIQKLIRESKQLSFENQIDYHQVFERLFTSLSGDLRAQVFDTSFIDDVSTFFDSRCLNFILSHLDSDCRRERIEVMKPKVLKFVERGCFEWLGSFMEEVLTSDEERNDYKTFLLNSLDRFLMDGKNERVDKLFDFFQVEKEERKRIIKELDHLKICEHFVKGYQWRYDQAEKFLEWSFENPVERDNFRYSLDDDWFIRERTSRSWEEMLNQSFKNKSDIRKEYCKFFFGFPEEIESLKNGEDFFSFREKCGKHFIEIYGGRRSRLKKCDNIPDLFDLYIKWVCKDEARRNAIRANYRNDDEIRFFCEIVNSLLNFAESKGLTGQTMVQFNTYLRRRH